MKLELNQDRFLQILTGLIAQTEHLQNHPPKHVPREDLAGRIVLEMLEPHTEKNGGIAQGSENSPVHTVGQKAFE